QLGPLANNGGPTPTRIPTAASPVRNAGVNPAALVTDQRGPGFSRQVGGAVDIGAVESSELSPSAVVLASDVLNGGAANYTFTFQYDGSSNLDMTTIIGNDNAIRVIGPGGFNVPAHFISIDDPTPGLHRTATYQIAAPDGFFDPNDTGTYSVVVQVNQIK